jgi:1,2-phenylacetyl-CoA epoxidase catalytic subunit
MSNLCKALKEYCVDRLESQVVRRFLPGHYVAKVQKKAREKGLEIPEKQKIRNVVHQRFYDKDIVDILVEVAEECKAALQIS